METAEILALTGGYVNDELLIRNEYLAAENEILRSKVHGPIRLNNDERIRLAIIGKHIGIKALKDVAAIVKPETIMAWFRKLVAKKFDGSKNRKNIGRRRIDPEIRDEVLRIAGENSSWGYDRITGALSNLGYNISDQTVGNILKENGIAPTPSRKPEVSGSWHDFIENHKEVMSACDFFTTEIITPSGLITFFVLFFIHISTREVHIAGITDSPDEQWIHR